MTGKEIKFKELNDEIKADYLSLQVYDYQKSFIETPQGSLDDMETRAWNICWKIECIFAGESMIGYAMHGEGKNGDVWLDRFMIDRRFQGKGYGSLALAEILKKLEKLYPGRNRILLSVEPGNDNAVRLYEKYGFRFTGDIEDNEKVMALLK